MNIRSPSYGEALKSKALVEDLKARGVVSSRRSRAAQASVGGPTVPQEKSAELVLADSMGALSALASDLLSGVERLESLTAQKSSHFEGFSVGLRSLYHTIDFCELNMSSIGAIQETASDARKEDDEGKKEKKADLTEQMSQLATELQSACTFLLEQHFSCLALFSLSAAHFSLACEFSRIMLKRRGASAEPAMWILRALSFAGMGNAYLANLHCKAAQKCEQKLEGLDEVSNLLRDLELSQITEERTQKTVVERLLVEVRRGLYFLAGEHDQRGFLSDSPNLLAVRKEDFQCLLELPHASVVLDATEESLEKLMMREIEAAVLRQQDDKLQNNSIYSMKARLKANSYMRKLIERRRIRRQEDMQGLKLLLAFELSRRLFYEGQVLLLERMHASAERKYLAALHLFSALLHSDVLPCLAQELAADCESGEEDVRGFLCAMRQSCRHNIDCSRAARGIDALDLPSHGCICGSSLCDRAIHLRQLKVASNRTTSHRVDRLSSEVEPALDVSGMELSGKARYVASYVSAMQDNVCTMQDSTKLRVFHQLFVSGCFLSVLNLDQLGCEELRGLMKRRSPEEWRSRLLELLRRPAKTSDRELLQSLNAPFVDARATWLSPVSDAQVTPDQWRREWQAWQQRLQYERNCLGHKEPSSS